MAFIENPILGSDSLYLQTESSIANNAVLKLTPGIFRIKMLNFIDYRTDLPLFYSDDYRTFFVSTKAVKWPRHSGIWGYYSSDYYFNIQPIENRNTFEKMRFEVSYPRSQKRFDLYAVPSADFAPIRPNIIALDDIKGIKKPFCKFPLSSQYFFENFYHPFVCTFIRELNRNGIDSLLRRDLQRFPHLFSYPLQVQEFSFEDTYGPVSVAEPYPVENVDFSENRTYAQYNWELFFHVPLLISDHLSKNQKHREARKWLHYIFDPTDVSSEAAPQRYWQMAHFFETTTQTVQEEEIRNMLRRYAEGTAENRMVSLAERWADSPFNPHLVARLRRTAYQRHVVMRYIDDLIAEGDQLFRRDTLEDVNEATQLYILAANILGPRPEIIPRRAEPGTQTFNSIEPLLSQGNGALSNPLVEIEQLVTSDGGEVANPVDNDASDQMPKFLYFCVPHNDKLLGYWDKVADRLFKIRHCMNIEGVVRELPLFQPPIDPGLLVRAAAAGIDISSALNDLNAAVPHYRFNVMAPKATELCSDLKALGGALLSALEKKDAEELALLRSTQELKLLNAVKQIREKQVDEAKETLKSLNRSKELTTIRRDYYENLERNAWEIGQEILLGNSIWLQWDQTRALELAAVMKLFPNIKIGSPTTAGATTGGTTFGAFAETLASVMGATASTLASMANSLGVEAGHTRRQEEWDHQVNMAEKEIEQIDSQIAAANIRLAIAENELSNHEQQIKNADEIDEFMRDKFTNQELYSWMKGQISNVYFQSYQLAYDVTKRAEMAFRFELGLQESNFIRFGYWDSLKKGLLAGDRLFHDLKRMEVAYLDQNKREFEITKHISLAIFDPVALIKLKESGTCFVHLPEVLFDIDYSGHYMRRIKSASFTIPAVTGPYTNVNCTLTLLKSSVRINTTLNGNNDKYDRQGQDDSRFSDTLGIADSIVTSNAQNDAGMFEFNLRDERYLPFEGFGAVSDWRIELPKDYKTFDYNTITDVILHIRYTARDGGSRLKEAASSSLNSRLQNIQLSNTESGLVRAFSAKHDFPTNWHRFFNPAPVDTNQQLEISIDQNEFPKFLSNKSLMVTNLQIILILQDPNNPEVYPNGNPPDNSSPETASFLSTTVEYPIRSSSPDVLERTQSSHFLIKDAQFGNQPQFSASMEFWVPKTPHLIKIIINTEDLSSVPKGLIETRDGRKRLNRLQVKDMLFIISYTST